MVEASGGRTRKIRSPFGAPSPRSDAVLFSDGLEPGNPVEIDERPRRDETEIHHRDETLTTRQKTRLTLVSREQGDRFFERVDGVVLEFGRLHLNPARE